MSTTSFYARIARYYDSEHWDKDEDFAFYDSIVDEIGGPVLVVGSGTGRLAAQLAAQDHHVHGIEIEKAMLDRATANPKVQAVLGKTLFFHQGDALKVKLSEQFNCAIVPYNTFMHFTEEDDQRKLLKRIHDGLNAGGVLLLDLPNAGEAFSAQDTETLTYERDFIDRDTGHLVIQQSISRLDRVEQIMDVKWVYDEIDDEGRVIRTFVPVRLYYFFRRELELLLESVGFEVEAVMGDFDGTPFEDGVPRMIFIARRK